MNLNSYGNDEGYGNDVGFEENGDIDNSIEYLDLFYIDCINNREIHNALMKKKRGQSKVNLVNVILLLGLIMVLTGASYSIPLFISIMLLAFAYYSYCYIFRSIFNYWKKGRNKYQNDEFQSSDNIHYEYLGDYLCQKNLVKFAGRNSRCLTQQNTFVVDSSVSVKFAVLMAMSVMVIGLLSAFIKFGSDWSSMGPIVGCLGLLSMGCLGVGYISYYAEKYLKTTKYDEIVDAVCVEVNKRISHGDHHHNSIVYQPVFYAKCQNGHKYLLFENKFNIRAPSVGDIVPLKVNSKNPLEWAVKNNFRKYLCNFIIGFGCAVPGIAFFILLITS